MGQVEQNAPLSYQWTHAWRSSDKSQAQEESKGLCGGAGEKHRRGERVAKQPVTQQGCAVVMVGATRTSWSVMQVSQEQLFGTHMWEPQMHKWWLYLCDVERKTPTALSIDKTPSFGKSNVFGTAQALPTQSVPPACAPTATTGLVSAIGQEGWPQCPGAAAQPGDYFLVTAALTQTWKLHWFTGLSCRGTLSRQALPFQPLYNWQ